MGQTQLLLPGKRVGPGCQSSNMPRGVIMHVCEFHLSFTANWKE